MFKKQRIFTSIFGLILLLFFGIVQQSYAVGGNKLKVKLELYHPESMEKRSSNHIHKQTQQTRNILKTDDPKTSPVQKDLLPKLEQESQLNLLEQGPKLDEDKWKFAFHLPGVASEVLQHLEDPLSLLLVSKDTKNIYWDRIVDLEARKKLIASFGLTLENRKAGQFPLKKIDENIQNVYFANSGQAKEIIKNGQEELIPYLPPDQLAEALIKFPEETAGNFIRFVNKNPSSGLLPHVFTRLTLKNIKGLILNVDNPINDLVGNTLTSSKEEITLFWNNIPKHLRTRLILDANSQSVLSFLDYIPNHTVIWDSIRSDINNKINSAAQKNINDLILILKHEGVKALNTMPPEIKKYIFQHTSLEHIVNLMLYFDKPQERLTIWKNIPKEAYENLFGKTPQKVFKFFLNLFPKDERFLIWKEIPRELRPSYA